MPLFQYAGFELIFNSGCPSIGAHRQGVQAFFAHRRLPVGKKKGFSMNSVSRMSGEIKYNT